MEYPSGQSVLISRDMRAPVTSEVGLKGTWTALSSQQHVDRWNSFRFYDDFSFGIVITRCCDALMLFLLRKWTQGGVGEVLFFCLLTLQRNGSIIALLSHASSSNQGSPRSMLREAPRMQWNGGGPLPSSGPLPIFCPPGLLHLPLLPLLPHWWNAHTKS